MSIRFYTQKDKQHALNYLEQAIRENLVDDIMILYLNKINALDGIFTGSCCSGHSGNKLGYITLKIMREGFDNLFAYPRTIINPFREDNIRATLECGPKGFVYFHCFRTKSGNETKEVMDNLYKTLHHYLK